MHIICTNMTSTNTPTPGKQLHIAIARNDWPTAKSIIEQHKSIAGSAKNSSGSTPLMMAANGKCGKNNKLLLELLLIGGNGGKESAAERNKRGKTAADMAEELGKHEIANQLRQYEQIASSHETFHRCPKCKTKLRPRSKLAFVRDQVTKGIETNQLVLELFNDHPLAVKRLDDVSLHRVNCCLSFRKELTESMALVSELKKLRQADDDDNDELKQLSWKDWHIVDLCSGAQCVTAALCLSILTGVSVTALDIVSSNELPHFEDVDWMTVSKVGNGVVEDDMHTSDDKTPTDDGMLSSFSYMQRDIHDTDLAPQLRSHISKGNTTSYSGKMVIVLAMHCCGALSQRALSLFKELDAAAILVMPCCLPPKHLGYSKKLKTFDPQQAATSWNPTHIKRDDDENKAMNEIFSTNDQDEQYRRWTRYLHQCAMLDGITTVDNTAALCKNVYSTLKEVDAVLSSRNTLITAIRNGSELANATNNDVKKS